jgi:hypothetical protein
MHVETSFVRNLGDLICVRQHTGPAHEGNSRTMGMHAGEESDGCIVPRKPRTMPSDIGGGDGGGKAAGRGEGELRPHAPDTAPEPACHRSGEPTDRSCKGTQYPEGRSRLT